MTALRWTLGGIATLAGAGFLALAVLSNSFRRSFGASEHGALVVGMPLAALALLLASVMFPGSKPLLHVAAVAAAGLVALCVWQICTEGALPLWFVLGYLAAWSVYYWLAAWRVPGS